MGPAFGKLAADGAAVVIVLGNVTFVPRRQFAAFALAPRLPSVYSFREHVEAGGLISYGIASICAQITDAQRSMWDGSLRGRSLLAGMLCTWECPDRC
jgi:hypothetical protein